MKLKIFKREIKNIFFRIYYIGLLVGRVLEKIKDNRFKREKIEENLIDILSDKKMVRVPITIAEVKDDKKGIVTIISDDGFFDSGVLLNQLVKEYEICATVAGAVSILKPHVEEWKKIVSEGYIEVVNHSYKHIVMNEKSDISKNRNRLYYELIGAKRWIERYFQLNKQLVFVCPGNMMCQLGYKVLNENGFLAVRRGDRGYNSLSPQNGTNRGQWFNLMVQGIGDEGTCTQVRNHWVDYAIENHQWLIEMWHNVAEKEDGYYQTILKKDAEEHIKYISKCKREQQIWVATYSEATKYLRAKQAITVNAYFVDNCIYVLTEVVDEKIPKEIFDYPITVKIDLPDDLKAYTFFIDGKKVPLVDRKILMFNIMPNDKVTKISMKLNINKE